MNDILNLVLYTKKKLNRTPKIVSFFDKQNQKPMTGEDND